MKKRRIYAVVGGDSRSAHLAGRLADNNSDNKIYALFIDHGVKLSGKVVKSEDIKLVLPQSDVVIFPIPAADSSGIVNTPLSDVHISLEECFDYIQADTAVLAGQVSENMRSFADRKGIYLADYLAREEFAVLNAVPTAEGAVEIALRELPVTLFKSTCMVTGYGRISKTLVRLLLAFGARVLVVARKHSDLSWIGINGAIPVHISDIDDHLRHVDVLFNTVPAMILNEEKLEKLSRGCLVIDLASKPGGVDFETASALGLKTVWALSLPGKVAPVSAGEIIYSTISNILSERGIHT